MNRGLLQGVMQLAPSYIAGEKSVGDDNIPPAVITTEHKPRATGLSGLIERTLELTNN